jgi:hypothetical protein
MDYKELKEQVREEWKRYYFFVRCDKYMVNAFNRSLDDLSHLKFEGYRIIEDYDTRHEFAHIISEMMTLGKLFGKYKFRHRVMKFVKYHYLTYKFNKLP